MNKKWGALFVVGVLFLAFFYIYYQTFHRSLLKKTPDLFVVSPRDTGRSIALKLEKDGLIPSSLLFRLLMRGVDGGHQLQAGQYQFQGGDTPAQILSKMMVGDRVMTHVLIPEGLTSQQIIRKFSELNGEELSPLGLKNLSEVYPDGTLFPETYHFYLPISLQEALSLMAQKSKEIQSYLRSYPLPAPLKNFREVVIVASIVEKEAVLDRERSLIASVFLSRLKAKMPLQADPTVVYAQTKGLGELPSGRLLSREDLKIQSPFNTYLNRGLPPAPICNPGLASLKAVLASEAGPYLYFVSDGKGGHLFAKTLKQHIKNVHLYKRQFSLR